MAGVYIIQMEINHGPVKIGYSSTNIPANVAARQIWSPYNLRLLRVIDGLRSLESLVHFYFRSYHFRGEWFHFTKTMMTVTPEEIYAAVGGKDRPARIFWIRKWERQRGIFSWSNKYYNNDGSLKTLQPNP